MKEKYLFVENLFEEGKVFLLVKKFVNEEKVFVCGKPPR